MVQANIQGFRQRFTSIKMSTINCLQKCHIAVSMVMFILTSVTDVDEHNRYLKDYHKEFHDCKNLWELFGMLNFYWNYLSYHLLDQLIEQLAMKYKSFKTVSKEMKTYKNDLCNFRKQTQLNFFCEAQRVHFGTSTADDPPPGFEKIVVDYKWPETVTLEDVELFRQRYAYTYNLKECAMIVKSIRRGSFKVTWFLPFDIIETLKKHRALKLYKEFEITRLEIAGSCIYQIPVQRHVSW